MFRIAVGLVSAIPVLAVVGWWFFCGPVDAGMFGGIVGGLITAVATLALIWLGIKQLTGLGQHGKCRFRIEARR